VSYVLWAVVAMLAYGITAVFLKLALRDIPPEVTLVITNTMLVTTGVVLIVLKGESLTAHLNFGQPLLYAGLAGLTLSLSIASYYIALSRGPTSVVVPIFAMYFAVTTIVGFMFLDEEFKLTRVAGIVMAAGAVVLLTR